jgi:adenylate cyclase
LICKDFRQNADLNTEVKSLSKVFKPVKPVFPWLCVAALGYWLLVSNPFWGYNVITGLSLRLNGSRQAVEPVIVKIDSSSLAKLGKWPWNRKIIAGLIERISQADPAAVGIDILFSEPAPEDLVLSGAIRQNGHICLAEYRNFKVRRSLFNTAITAGRVEQAVASIGQAAAGTGFIDVFSDPDGHVRSMPLQYGAHLGFAAAVLKQAYPRIMLPRTGEIILKLAGRPRDFTAVSVGDIWSNPQLAGKLRRKIVLIGLTAPGLTDRRQIPVIGNIPGVYLHAYTISNLVDWGFVRKAPGMIVLLLSLFGMGIVAAVKTRYRIVTGISVIVGSVPLSYFLLQYGLWISPLSPAFMAAATLSLLIRQDLRRVKAEQSQLEVLIRKYLPFLSGERRRLLSQDLGVEETVTVLFADLRSYTALAERLSPARLGEVLNRHLTLMADAIQKQGGIIDKYTGDGVMALFREEGGALNHNLRAIRAAVEIQRALDRHRDLSAGIGIASGKIRIGNIGSDSRQDFTAIGDVVNIASRLEKIAQPGQIVMTAAAAAGLRLVESGVPVRLKGRRRTVRIFSFSFWDLEALLTTLPKERAEDER